MTRRRALDWVLIVLLTLSWGVLFARGVGEGLRTQRGKLQVGVASASSAEAYPTVKPSLWQPGQVASGDEVTAVDGRDLRGFSALRFYDLATRAARERGFTEIALSRSGSPFTLGLTLEPMPLWWLGSVFSVLLMASRVVPAGARARLAPLTALPRRCVVLRDTPRRVRWGWTCRAGFGSHPYVSLLCLGCALHRLERAGLHSRGASRSQAAPDLRPPLRDLVRRPYLNRYFLSYGRTLSDLAASAAVAALTAATIAGLARAYARSEPLERRQIRWVVLGYLRRGGRGAARHSHWARSSPERRRDPQGSVFGRALLAITGMAIPLGLMVSVIGYRWLDIDRLISGRGVVHDRRRSSFWAVRSRWFRASRPPLRLHWASIRAIAQWLLTMAARRSRRSPRTSICARASTARLFAERHRRMSGFAQLVDDDRPMQRRRRALAADLRAHRRAARARVARGLRARGQRLRSPLRARRGEPAPVRRRLAARARARAARDAARGGFARARPVRPRRARDARRRAGVPIRTREGLLAFACLGRKALRRHLHPRGRSPARRRSRCAAHRSCARMPERPPELCPQVFRREGELWTVASRGKQIHLRDMRGLHYLATLLREPGREFEVLDLVRTASGPAPVGSSRLGAGAPRGRRLGDAGPVLDLKPGASTARAWASSRPSSPTPSAARTWAGSSAPRRSARRCSRSSSRAIAAPSPAPTSSARASR